jgi:Ca2+-binding EF-hand superfamily protein
VSEADAEKAAQMKQYFSMIDVDASGEIDSAELGTALRSIGFPITND